ncbi:MAG: hypothetical protein ACM3PW_11440 [Chlamydiota bacterium]
MDIATELKKCGIGAAVALLALGGSLWAQERSLPEVAKEKGGKTAARVFTNEDLEAARPEEEGAAPPLEKAEEKPAAPGKEDARITVPGLLQEGSVSEARALLKSLQHDEEVLLRRYAQIQDKLSRESDEHLRQLYSNSLARRDETLARKRRQIEQVEKAIRAASRGSKNEPETGVEK